MTRVTIPPDRARSWLARYEAMMRREVDHREAQLDALIEVARSRLADPGSPGLVVELGCGPGTLSRRLVTALPASQLVAVDADPVLLALARSQPHPRLRFVDATIGAGGWQCRLRLPGPADLVVAAAVVHYLDARQAARWYHDVAELLRDGGALVIADAFAAHDLGTRPDDLDQAPVEPAATGESWTAWWAAVTEDPELGPLVARGAGPACDGDHHLDADEHTALLQRAGFAQVTVARRLGQHAVLVAQRR